jgi:hypothetical protein
MGLAGGPAADRGAVAPGYPAQKNVTVSEPSPPGTASYPEPARPAATSPLPQQATSPDTHPGQPRSHHSPFQQPLVAAARELRGRGLRGKRVRKFGAGKSVRHPGAPLAIIVGVPTSPWRELT